ncbi:protein of unknown function [Methylocaldum szegediense]|uniref:Uncharacterized protein n=1 Tax=Methylocaldum szegediense TaxID=73780 RepID=A0ABM9HZ18_9GAMM|nr:protein of unknown function [Methylocaldum szegediense]
MHDSERRHGKSATIEAKVTFPPNQLAKFGKSFTEAHSISLKKLFGAPQIGQTQSSGMSSQRVPGAIPLSGSPLASS